jgi:hypothetical protein
MFPFFQGDAVDANARLDSHNIVVHQMSFTDGPFILVSVNDLLEKSRGVGRRSSSRADLHGIDVIQSSSTDVENKETKDLCSANSGKTQLNPHQGIATPTREQFAKLDRKRARKGSNEEWINPHDPEARITKPEDGRTHQAHKAEHAVDLETGAVIAVTVAAGDARDTATIMETLPQVGEHIAEVACTTNNEEGGQRVHQEGPRERPAACSGYTCAGGKIF